MDHRQSRDRGTFYPGNQGPVPPRGNRTLIPKSPSRLVTAGSRIGIAKAGKIHSSKPRTLYLMKSPNSFPLPDRHRCSLKKDRRTIFFPSHPHFAFSLLDFQLFDLSLIRGDENGLLMEAGHKTGSRSFGAVNIPGGGIIHGNTGGAPTAAEERGNCGRF